MRTVQKTGRVEVVVAATPEQVWAVASDVTRTGEWSHECVAVEWLGGATRAAVGARFRGRNQAGPWRWGRVCELVTVDPPREIAWRTVPTPLFPDSTEWRLRLEPAGDATRVTQAFEVVRAPWLLDRVYASVVPTHRDRDARLTEDLARLGAVAGGAPLGGRSGSRPPAAGRRMTRIGNRVGVWMYRTLDGRLSSGSKDVHVLMITTPGRRTGIPRSTCVRYLETPQGYVVWGTGSGSPRDPDWFENLRRASTASIQVRDRHLAVRPHELHGEERDDVWRDTVLAQAPEVSRYARKAGRTIPVAVLEPVGA